MKKTIVALALLFVPLLASASIDANLYYGLKNNSEVRELQEFLIEKNLLTGSATGNFYSLTLGAVKKYQASASINSTGYVGMLTRASINTELAANLSASNEESISETGTTPPVVSSVDPMAALQAQIAALQAQLNQSIAAQNSSNQSTQNGVSTPVFIPAAILGCTDGNAKNYKPNANKDDGSCEKWPAIAGTCTVDKTVAPIGADHTTGNITWTVSATGGDGNYQYTWFGGPCNASVSGTCTRIFGEPNTSVAPIETQSRFVLIRSGSQWVSLPPLNVKCPDVLVCKDHCPQ